MAGAAVEAGSVGMVCAVGMASGACWTVAVGEAGAMGMAVESRLRSKVKLGVISGWRDSFTRGVTGAAGHRQLVLRAARRPVPCHLSR